MPVSYSKDGVGMTIPSGESTDASNSRDYLSIKTTQSLGIAVQNVLLGRSCLHDSVFLDRCNMRAMHLSISPTSRVFAATPPLIAPATESPRIVLTGTLNWVQGLDAGRVLYMVTVTHEATLPVSRRGLQPTSQPRVHHRSALTQMSPPHEIEVRLDLAFDDCYRQPIVIQGLRSTWCFVR
ncbi:hypothetical protein BDR05DRAFT_992129 [Suillus weaverae]|nr:hypothetical protein BDR05DRAFT_992129 [Suillus weaverae]